MNGKYPFQNTQNLHVVALFLLFVGLWSCEQKPPQGTSSTPSNLELSLPEEAFAGPAGRVPVLQRGPRPTGLTAPGGPFEPAGTLVAGSEKCRDCDYTFAVHDGKGGRLRRSKANSKKCCPCGSTQQFRDGNRYQIRCENGRMVAKMISEG